MGQPTNTNETEPEASAPSAVGNILVLHPPLLAIYRLLLLYANNIEKTPLTALVRPALLLAGGAVAVWLVLWALLRNRYKAGIVASILILATLTGWHVLEYGLDVVVPKFSGFPGEAFYVLYAAAVAGGVLMLARHYRGQPRTAARRMIAAGVAAVALLLAVLYGLVPVFGMGPAWAMVLYLAIVVAGTVYLISDLILCI